MKMGTHNRRLTLVAGDREKKSDLHVKGASQAFDHEHSRIALTTLNAADVRPIETMLEREPLLTETAFAAQLAQVVAEHLACIHRTA